MWRRFWLKWTVDKPAAFGDELWEVCVVQFAAFLSRLTLRQVIAFIPVLILVLAYAHRIPIPPELMLVGDVLAYIDIYSMILLASFIGRAAASLRVVRQIARGMLGFLDHARLRLRNPDSRHRRVTGVRKPRRWIGRAGSDDDGHPGYDVAWA